MSEDFARHDVIGAAEESTDPYPGARLWIDVGSEDPFRSADTRFAGILKGKGLPLQFHIWPGDHDQSYWQSHWGSYLGFYATALEDCHRREILESRGLGPGRFRGPGSVINVSSVAARTAHQPRFTPGRGFTLEAQVVAL